MGRQHQQVGLAVGGRSQPLGHCLDRGRRHRLRHRRGRHQQVRVEPGIQFVAPGDGHAGQPQQDEQQAKAQADIQVQFDEDDAQAAGDHEGAEVR
jgi:hypothetical protein